MAGRISVGAINHAFLDAGGNVNECGAAIHRAVADGWLEVHPSGAYVKLMQKGADSRQLRQTNNTSRNRRVNSKSARLRRPQ
jgi:hypothetical protein